MDTQITSTQLLQQLQQMRRMAAGEVQPATAEGEGFGRLLQQAIDQVNHQQKTASAMATAFEGGDRSVELVDVMIQMNKAKISFEALTQVRNRLLSAYQDIMNMQL